MQLFAQPIREINLKPGELKIWPSFLREKESLNLFLLLREEIDWQEETILIFGKLRKIPRLQAWFGEEGTDYSYSGIDLISTPFNETLLKIKTQIEKATGFGFNSCLLNYYRDGSDSMGWHSDNEKELGNDPIIASLSIGAERKFRLRSSSDHKINQSLILTSGSLLLMGKGVQRHWQHSVPKTKRIEEGRINLTFRKIIKSHKKPATIK